MATEQSPATGSFCGSPSFSYSPNGAAPDATRRAVAIACQRESS